MKQEFRTNFVEAAVDAFGLGSERGGGKRAHFNRSDFFHSWLRQRDQAFVFIFKDSLATTNIQIAELISLVQQHSTNSINQGQAAHGISFSSQADYYSAIEKLIEPLTLINCNDSIGVLSEEMIRKIKEHVDNVWGTYEEMLSNSVVLEIYNATACLFLPPTLKVNINKICAASGYIFACGHLVYVRNSKKATFAEFNRELGDNLHARKSSLIAGGSQPVNFRFYFQERFPEERTDAPALNGMKFLADKSALGNDNFGSIEALLRANFPTELRFPDFDEAIGIPGMTEEESSSTIWMLMDRGAGLGDGTPSGEERFFLVYEQLHRNANPLDYFDENKPGWLTQTTIPHRLYRAMINITKPWKANREHFNLYDPFCGTGTGAYEAVGHFGDQLHFFGGDAEDFLKFAWTDNKLFFSDPTHLAKAISVLTSLVKDADSGIEVPVHNTIEHLVNYEDKKNDENEKRKKLDLLSLQYEKLTFEMRVQFWIGIRVLRRLNSTGKELASRAGKLLVKEYAGILLKQSKRYEYWHNRLDRSSVQTEDVVEISGLSFSNGSTYGLDELRRGLDDAGVKIKFGKEGRIGEVDAKPIQVEIDIIVTDPPYGFNTVENASELMVIYQKFLDESIAKLSNGGHLVLCLPDKSYVGKSFPFFTVPGLVVAQVLAVAERNGRVAYIEAQSLPTPRSFFAPPYYWKSARALKRAILHFRFVKKEHMRV